VEVAGFVIGCIALVVALGGLGWQIYAWRHAHRFDVRVRIEPEMIPLAEKRYEVTVVVQNLGSTEEAVDSVALLYAHHHPSVPVDGIVLGPPSLLDRKGEPLPPRRNVRRTYDLLGTRFMEHFPEEVTAVVTLESGERIVSEPMQTSSRSLDVALGRNL
jgi:hypothetical protein